MARLAYAAHPTVLPGRLTANSGTLTAAAVGFVGSASFLDQEATLVRYRTGPSGWRPGWPGANSRTSIIVHCQLCALRIVASTSGSSTVTLPRPTGRRFTLRGSNPRLPGVTSAGGCSHGCPGPTRAVAGCSLAHPRRFRYASASTSVPACVRQSYVPLPVALAASGAAEARNLRVHAAGVSVPSHKRSSGLRQRTPHSSRPRPFDCCWPEQPAEYQRLRCKLHVSSRLDNTTRTQ